MDINWIHSISYRASSYSPWRSKSVINFVYARTLRSLYKERKSLSPNDDTVLWKVDPYENYLDAV